VLKARRLYALLPPPSTTHTNDPPEYSRTTFAGHGDNKGDALNAGILGPDICGIALDDGAGARCGFVVSSVTLNGFEGRNIVIFSELRQSAGA